LLASGQADYELSTKLDCTNSMKKPASKTDFLVVDDNPMIYRFLHSWLKDKGHTFKTFTDGLAACAWLKVNECEVAFVDLNIPKINGESIVTLIRESQNNIPIIIFTGVGYDEDMVYAALRGGADGYVSENLPIEQLYSVMQRVLTTSRHRRARAVNGGNSNR
jgi:DNA-binding response OmpR family regulator